MTLTAERGLKTHDLKKVLLGLSSSFPINYLYTVIGKYSTLCVQIVWLLDDANWHGVPSKPALSTLFTFDCMSSMLLSAQQWYIFILGARLVSFHAFKKLVEVRKVEREN